MAQANQITIRLSPQILGMVAGAILGIGGVGGTVIQLASPAVRSDPFTGTEFRDFYNREFLQLKQSVKEHGKWQREVDNIDAINSTEIKELHRRVEKLESQVLHLYRQEQKRQN